MVLIIFILIWMVSCIGLEVFIECVRWKDGWVIEMRGKEYRFNKEVLMNAEEVYYQS